MNHMGPVLRFSLAPILLAAAAAAQTGFPWQNESLHYSVNWPSGLSLGDAAFTVHKTDAGFDFSVTIDVAIPGFAVADKYHSSATAADLCSLELERDMSHASKKVREKTTFDQKKGTANRVTLFPAGGGKSDFDISSCPRDAIAFAYLARRELGQGRVPPGQQMFFGSAYSVRMDYTGAMTIPVAEKPTVTDHLVVSVKGPKSDFSFEVFYARDAARTPLVIKVPLPVGNVTMELVR
jgi:hypothetical protein